MATYKYCDHADHEKDGGKFTPAVAVVEVWKHKVEERNVLNMVGSKDACEAHIGEFANKFFKVNQRDVTFDYVRICPLDKPRKSV